MLRAWSTHCTSKLVTGENGAPARSSSLDKHNGMQQKLSKYHRNYQSFTFTSHSFALKRQSLALNA